MKNEVITTTSGEAQSGGNAVFAGVQNFAAELGQMLPEILGAIVVLIIGWILASVLGNLVRRLVIWSRIDSLLARTPSSAAIDNAAGMKVRVADIAKTIVKWFVILVTLALAADILNWTAVQDVLTSFIAYLPNIAAAILLLVGGYLLGNFVGNLVSGSTSTYGQRAADMAGGVVKWAVFVFAAMAALIQLGIAETIIHIAFIGLISMLALAGGLAFGLGGRDKARELLSEMRTPQRPMTV